LTVSNIVGFDGSYTITFGVSTTLRLTDSDGDSATLTLSGTPGFGYFVTIVSPNSETGALETRATISGTGADIVLSGTAKRGRNGNGLVSLPESQSLSVAPGTIFSSTLTNPPVRIGPLPQSVIDELLASSGGTLAGVLIAV
jgi:hypothetical protein